MGIISRFADIMDANINSVLGKAEDKNADKLLEKYLKDSQENLANVKAETAAVMAEEMAASRRLNDCQANITKYEGYATAAVKAGNDDDARKFLTYKGELSAKKADLEADYNSAKANSEKMREMTNKLAEDVRGAQEKMSELRAKLAMAKAQEKTNTISQKMGGGMGDFDSMLDKVQKRIDTADAAATMNNDPHDDLEEMAKKYDAPAAGASSVDDELAKLKASMQ